MNQEIWKDIPNYKGLYQASNLGRIKSLERKVKSKNNSFRTEKEKILSLAINGSNYLNITLCKFGKNKQRTVHQLVAEAFLGHSPNGYKVVVNHINFIKTDNRVENLELITARQNTNLRHVPSTSKYVGVSWNKKLKKWSSYIIINNKKKHLGYFINEIEAHEAYKMALKGVVLDFPSIENMDKNNFDN